MKKIILFIVILIVVLAAKTDAATLNIAQVTDVHLSVYKQNLSARNTTDSLSNLIKTVNSINRQKDIDFVVFTGDNIDRSDTEELKAFCKQVQNLNKPYYILPGNHDVHKAGGMSKADFTAIVKKMNPNQYTESSNYSFFPAKGFVAIAIDGTVPVLPSAHGYFNPEALKWLDNQLTKNKNKKALIFQHFPLLPPRDDYSHTILEPEEYEKTLEKHENVLLIASGHYHKEMFRQDNLNIYHISSPSLLTKPSQYAIIQINYTKRLFGPPSKIEVKTKLVNINL